MPLCNYTLEDFYEAGVYVFVSSEGKFCRPVMSSLNIHYFREVVTKHIIVDNVPNTPSCIILGKQNEEI